MACSSSAGEFCRGTEAEGENSGASQELQEADQVLFSNFETKSVHLDLLKGPLDTSGLDSPPRA